MPINSHRTACESRIDLHKMLCRELIFGSSELQQIEFKGGRILRQLGHMLFQNYLETKTSPSCWCRTTCIAPWWRPRPGGTGASLVRLRFRHDRRLRAAQLQTAPRSRLRLDLRTDLKRICLPFHCRTDLPRAGQPARFTWQLWHAVPDARLLLVDDASGTARPRGCGRIRNTTRIFFCWNARASSGSARPISPGLNGHPASRHGTCSAVVQMDADLSHNPIPCRTCSRSWSRGRPGPRHPLPPGRPRDQLAAAPADAESRRGQVCEWITGMPFTDPTGVQGFPSRQAGDPRFVQVHSDGYAFQIEVTYIAWRLGWKIEEVPSCLKTGTRGSRKCRPTSCAKRSGGCRGLPCGDRFRRARL